MIRTYYQISVEKKAATGRITHVRLSYFGKVLEFGERWLAHEKQKELGIEGYSQIVSVNRRVDLKAGEFCEMCGRTSRLAVAQKPDDKLITACGLCRQGLKELRKEQANLTPLQIATKRAHEAAGEVEYYNEGEYCEDINKDGETCLDRDSNAPCSPCMSRIDNINEEAGE